MVDDPEGRATDFDKKIPGDVRGESDIADYMDDEWGHILPQDFIDQVAPHVEKKRAAGDTELGIASSSDAVLDTDTGRWRDPETGEFTSPPDDQ